MNPEKPTRIVSPEVIEQQYLQNRQEALEKREEFTEALEKVSNTNELITVVRRFAFVSNDLNPDGELMIPGFKEVFPEYRNKPEFGLQHDNHGIDTQYSLESTLNAIEGYNRGETGEYQLYEEVGFNSPVLPVLERITGITLDSLIAKDIEESDKKESVVIEGSAVKKKGSDQKRLT